MKKDIKKLIINYGMQKTLEDLISIIIDINNESNKKYLSQLVKDLRS